MARVRELLQGKHAALITARPDMDLGTAAHLLQRYQIGGLPVVEEEGRLVGFLAEGDIVRAVDRGADAARGHTVSRFMQPPPTCSAEDSLHDVMSRMTRERNRHLVVLDAGEIAGIISIGDLVKHRLDELETETGVLRDYVVASRARM
jgi:CBS domain-containing protein